ncbi:hypothetical protein evm_004460 [Chilo suppressalis]|nr:hypothetical protein evm_004460 [Chilo suppressalis]
MHYALYLSVHCRKPRLATCVTLALGMCAITVSAVAIGIVIGYTYCYLEHHSGYRAVPGNYTHTSYHQILNISYPDNSGSGRNRTINGALASSVLVTRILSLGQALMQDQLIHLPWHDDTNILLHYT